MATTANLTITKIDSSQNQGGVTANTAFDSFDAAHTEFTKTISDANYTLATGSAPPEWHYLILNISGTLTANRNIICPTNKKAYILCNNTSGGFDLTLKTSGGTGVAVSPGKASLVRCDGTNVVRASDLSFKRIGSLAYSGSISVDWSLYDIVRITLTGNTTLSFSGAVDGQNCMLEVTQDGTGGRTVTWPAAARWPTDVPTPTLSSASKMDKIGFIYNNPAAKYDAVAVVKGYS